MALATSLCKATERRVRHLLRRTEYLYFAEKAGPSVRVVRLRTAIAASRWKKYLGGIHTNPCDGAASLQYALIIGQLSQFVCQRLESNLPTCV